MNLYTIEVEKEGSERKADIPVAAPDVRKAIATAAFALEPEGVKVVGLELAARDVEEEHIPAHALRWTEDDGISYNFLAS